MSARLPNALADAQRRQRGLREAARKALARYGIGDARLRSIDESLNAIYQVHVNGPGLFVPQSRPGRTNHNTGSLIALMAHKRKIKGLFPGDHIDMGECGAADALVEKRAGDFTEVASCAFGVVHPQSFFVRCVLHSYPLRQLNDRFLQTMHTCKWSAGTCAVHGARER